ncbi:MAG: PAS domain S-box protein [Cytophagales bacterium]|nr:PAS domain S-box protein [Cytophagales bacterium]
MGLFDIKNIQFLLDSLDEFVIVIDNKLIIHYMNDVFKKQYAQFIGANIKVGDKYYEYSNEPKHQETKHRIEKAFNNQKQNFVRKASHNGKVIWLEIKYVPIPDEGRINYISVIIKNITEQKISEEHNNNYLNQLKAIYHNSREMIVLINKQRQILSFNDKFEEQSFKILHRRPKLFDDYFHYVFPDDVEYTITRIDKCFEGEHIRFERHFILNHHSLWADVSYTPIYNADNTIDKILINILDITESKTNQLAEIRIKRKLEGIFDNSADALFITENNSNIILECNDTALKLFEANDKKDMIGKIGSSFHVNPLNEDERNLIIERMSKDESFSMIFEYKTFKNNTFWGSFSTTTIDLNTEKIRLIQISDISDLKLIQDELTNLVDFNKKINQLVPDVLYLFDFQSGENVFENRSMLETLGYTKQQYPKLTGQLLFELTHPDDMYKLYENMEKFKTLKNDETISTEFRMLNAQGEWRWILDRTSVFARDGNGHALQILGIGRDITERMEIIDQLKKTNDELSISNQELDNFVYRASHDLRAPLASVLGLINVAKIENKPESMLQYFDMIEKSIERLMNFTEDLIGYSRNARNDIKSQIINFSKITDEVIDSLKFLEKAHKIRFIKEVDINHAPFFSDKTRISMMLSNLVSNAIKYHSINKQDPYIKISCHVQNDIGTIAVQDNGTGIKEIYQEKIFDMFYRATTDTKGSGLGLYIVKSIVEKLNGNINFESVYMEGTQFVINIPSTLNVLETK